MTIADLQLRRADAQRIGEVCRMRAALDLIDLLVQRPTAANVDRIRALIREALRTPATDAALDIVADGLVRDSDQPRDDDVDQRADDRPPMSLLGASLFRLGVSLARGGEEL